MFSSAEPGRRTNVMNMQELARELGHPDAQKLLSGSLARLAYNGHDGFPRVIPVGFYWTGERIVVWTASTSPKARAFSSRLEVAVTIDTDTTPEEAKTLLMRGLATSPLPARHGRARPRREVAWLKHLIGYPRRRRRTVRLRMLARPHRFGRGSRLRRPQRAAQNAAWTRWPTSSGSGVRCRRPMSSRLANTKAVPA